MTSFGFSTPGNEVVTSLADQIHGKTILITGPSTGGIGAQTAIFLAAGNPAHILLAGRSLSKIQPVIETIKSSHPSVPVTFMPLDLSSLSSVRSAAKEISSKISKLDVLINNAGVMAIKDFTKTEDGIETQFGINHIGHFLLTSLLMPLLLAAPTKPARVINVSSFGYLCTGVRFNDWNFKEGKEYNPWLAYAQSKTANILFASALSRKFKSKGILAFSLHPGLITETKLQDAITPEDFAEGYKVTLESLHGFPMPDITPKSLEAGTSTTIVAASDPTLEEEGKEGSFLSDCVVYEGKMREHALGVGNEEALWELSERLVGERFEGL